MEVSAILSFFFTGFKYFDTKTVLSLKVHTVTLGKCPLASTLTIIPCLLFTENRKSKLDCSSDDLFRFRSEGSSCDICHAEIKPWEVDCACEKIPGELRVLTNLQTFQPGWQIDACVTILPALTLTSTISQEALVFILLIFFLSLHFQSNDHLAHYLIRALLNCLSEIICIKPTDELN